MIEYNKMKKKNSIQTQTIQALRDQVFKLKRLLGECVKENEKYSRMASSSPSIENSEKNNPKQLKQENEILRRENERIKKEKDLQQKIIQTLNEKLLVLFIYMN